MAKYWDGITEEFKAIPAANWYVLSNDKSMSQWGKAKGKINTCVVPCLNYEHAKAVMEYAEGRGDQKYVRMTQSPPKTKAHVLYSLCLGWTKTAKRAAQEMEKALSV